MTPSVVIPFVSSILYRLPCTSAWQQIMISCDKLPFPEGTQLRIVLFQKNTYNVSTYQEEGLFHDSNCES